MIKLAMPKVHKFLIEEKLQTKILLQVHDELDCSVQNLPQAQKIAAVMEKAVLLKVPSKCDIELGPNWGEPVV